MMRFGTRLLAVMERGDLTVADLHHWFSRPRPTVRTWVMLSHTPRGPAGALATERLTLLEQAVKDGGLPAPRTLSALERPLYIKQVRDGLERARVSAAGAA